MQVVSINASNVIFISSFDPRTQHTPVMSSDRGYLGIEDCSWQKGRGDRS